METVFPSDAILWAHNLIGFSRKLLLVLSESQEIIHEAITYDYITILRNKHNKMSECQCRVFVNSQHLLPHTAYFPDDTERFKIDTETIAKTGLLYGLIVEGSHQQGASQL